MVSSAEILKLQQQQIAETRHAHVSYAQVQKPAPVFSTNAVVDGEFKQVSLQDYKGKYVVLVFYPLDFTFVCPTEIIAFNERRREFDDANAQLLLCSIDSQYSHLAWTNQPRNQGGLGSIQVPILADVTKSIARDYGVLLDDGVAARGTFIIDDKGILRQMTVNDPPVGRSVDETLRLVKAYQYVDIHGEVCPINWMPGSSTIVPDVKQSKAYFGSVPSR